MTFSSAVAISVYIAALILHSYQPMTTLSWLQRAKRRRALTILSTMTIAAVFSENVTSDRFWAVAAYIAALWACGQFLRQLRQQGGIWMSSRFKIFTRLIAVGFAFGISTIGIYRPEIWGIVCIILGFWNAAVLNSESQEISNEFMNLKIRLTTIYAEQLNSKTTDSTTSAEPRDKLNEAS